MKKTIITILVLLTAAITYGQTAKNKYVEINTGFSTGIIPVFPGASVLYGATNRYSSGIVLDYEGGIAFPTLVTGKVGVGFMIDNEELTFGIRPWPATYYAQIRIDRPKKRSDVVLSVESNMFRESLVSQWGIFTIGWRFDNMRYSQVRHREK